MDVGEEATESLLDNQRTAAEKSFATELKHELDGMPFSKQRSQDKKDLSDEQPVATDDTRQKSNADEPALESLVLSKKKRGIYEAMQRNLKRKREKTEKLIQRKKKLESEN